MNAERRVILAGSGHAHLHLARQARAFVDRGIDLTLIAPGEFWYSGLATGMLGGEYERDEDTLDPGELIVANGGRMIRDRIVKIDRQSRRVWLDGGGELSYDLLSFAVGSEAALPSGLAGQPGIVAAKPLSNLWALREKLIDKWLHQQAAVKVCVVGGGATGCEIAANIDGLARRSSAPLELTLITDGARLLAQWPEGVARRLAKVLDKRGVRLVFNRRITGADDQQLIAVNGERFAYDLAVAATGLKPVAVLRQLDLPTNAAGGLRVDEKLRAIGDHRIYGAGDCIHFNGRALPRLGVFAVRQAPVLLDNLLAALDGRPQRAYKPQSRYLSILNLGDGTGLAVRGALHWRGRVSLWWKNRLDRQFLDCYRY